MDKEICDICEKECYAEDRKPINLMGFVTFNACFECHQKLGHYAQKLRKQALKGGK